MKAAYYYGVQDIRVEDDDIPSVGDDDILIRVGACAICGTDMRIYKFGHFKIKPGEKRVLGHEVAGEIVEAGKNVQGFKVGDRVGTPPNVGCGHCEMCMRGLNQLCRDYMAFGISYDGGMQEYMLIPSHAIAMGNVIKLPDSITFEEATLTEPLSCVYNSYEALRTRPGDSLLVIGAGPIGALHVMLNRFAGAAPIIVADIAQNRLDALKSYGADILINSADQDLKTAVMEITGGRGVDVVITACSVPEMQNLALEVAAPKGRINFFGGMPKGKENVTLDTNLIHYKELIALGTTGSSIQHYRESMKLLSTGRLDVKQLVTARFPVSQIHDGFEYALSGKGMKALVVGP